MENSSLESTFNRNPCQLYTPLIPYGTLHRDRFQGKYYLNPKEQKMSYEAPNDKSSRNFFSEDMVLLSCSVSGGVALPLPSSRPSQPPTPRCHSPVSDMTNYRLVCITTWLQLLQATHKCGGWPGWGGGAQYNLAPHPVWHIRVITVPHQLFLCVVTVYHLR